jgi:hypothetical protein
MEWNVESESLFVYFEATYREGIKRPQENIGVQTRKESPSYYNQTPMLLFQLGLYPRAVPKTLRIS